MIKKILTLLLSLVITSALAVDITPYFSIDGGYKGEMIVNAVGGLNTGFRYDGLIDLGIEFRSDSICKKWKGAKFRVAAQSAHGELASLDLIGEMQSVSNIAIGNFPFFLKDLYYSQEIGPVKIIAGLQDINEEYDHLDAASDLINSSWGISPIFANFFALPTYPNTALALDIKWNITPMWAWQAAVYDTPIPLSPDENPYNVNWQFSSEKGCQVVTEFHCTPTFKGNLEGAYKLGASIQTSTCTWGIVCNIEQDVYNKGSHMVNVFAKAGAIPQHGDFEGYSHAGIGAALFGVFSKKQHDMTSLAVTSSIYSFDSSIRHETIIEWTYKYNFLKNSLFLQPDIQYVISPNLLPDSSIPNALVFLLRFGAQF